MSGVVSDTSGLGSSTDLTAPKFDFRSSPESGLKSDIAPCPFRAPEAGIRLILSEMPDAQVAPYEQIGQTLRCIKDCQVTKVG